MEPAWPYDLPIWRRSLRATSPDGRQVAEIGVASEVSMGNPTQGTLRLSAGLCLERCNPSFVWSSDSRYLAVPQFFLWCGLFRRQRLLLVDVEGRAVFRSLARAFYFQPESFTDGRLRVTQNPNRKSPGSVEWRIPEDLPAQFRPHSVAPWS